jgi:hypothetical protein
MPSGRHPELADPRAHLPAPPRRHSPCDPQGAPSRHVGSPVVGGATNATLRANLHELAAEFHELAASVHDWRAEEHAQALRDSVGDANFHQLWEGLRRTAAAVERGSAYKDRHAAMYWRRHAEGDGDGAPPAES